MSGLVDMFWLWQYMLLAGVLGIAIVMALLIWWCVRIRDRWLGTTVAALGAWLAATWFGAFVRKHTRPRGT